MSMIRKSTLLALAAATLLAAGCMSTEKKDLKRDADRAKIEAIRAEKDRDTLKAEIESLKKAGQNANLDLSRVDYWIGNGAQPSETVASIIRNSRHAAKTAQLETASA
jgi:ribosomal protein S16